MWGLAFVVGFAAAAACVAAAFILQARSSRARAQAPSAAALSAPIPTPPPALPPGSAHEYLEGTDMIRPAGGTLVKNLRQHYLPIVDEPVPPHLLDLARQVDEGHPTPEPDTSQATSTVSSLSPPAGRGSG
jgi:hypothetical protein